MKQFFGLLGPLLFPNCFCLVTPLMGSTVAGRLVTVSCNTIPVVTVVLEESFCTERLAALSNGPCLGIYFLLCLSNFVFVHGT